MQDSIWFNITVTDTQGVTMAHIHSGKQGENGPPIVPLYKSDTPSGPIVGLLAKGNITADTFQGPMTGKQISDLITAMQNGETYVIYILRNIRWRNSWTNNNIKFYYNNEVK